MSRLHNNSIQQKHWWLWSLLPKAEKDRQNVCSVADITEIRDCQPYATFLKSNQDHKKRNHDRYYRHKSTKQIEENKARPKKTLLAPRLNAACSKGVDENKICAINASQLSFDTVFFSILFLLDLCVSVTTRTGLVLIRKMFSLIYDLREKKPPLVTGKQPTTFGEKQILVMHLECSRGCSFLHSSFQNSLITPNITSNYYLKEKCNYSTIDEMQKWQNNFQHQVCGEHMPTEYSRLQLL